MIGLLVPIREAGALLPQLITAPYIHRMSQRKWGVGRRPVWGQAFAAGLLVWIGLTLSGGGAGYAACGAVAILALSRSVASVSYKDILGKTIAKTRRGAVTGAAASISAIVVILFALLLMFAPVERFALVIGALALSAGFWLAAFAVFSTLREEARTRRGARRVFWRNWGCSNSNRCCGGLSLHAGF